MFLLKKKKGIKQLPFFSSSSFPSIIFVSINCPLYCVLSINPSNFSFNDDLSPKKIRVIQTIKNIFIETLHACGKNHGIILDYPRSAIFNCKRIENIRRVLKAIFFARPQQFLLFFYR